MGVCYCLVPFLKEGKFTSQGVAPIQENAVHLIRSAWAGKTFAVVTSCTVCISGTCLKPAAGLTLLMSQCVGPVLAINKFHMWRGPFSAEAPSQTRLDQPHPLLQPPYAWSQVYIPPRMNQLHATSHEALFICVSCVCVYTTLKDNCSPMFTVFSSIPPFGSKHSASHSADLSFFL